MAPKLVRLFPRGRDSRRERHAGPAHLRAGDRQPARGARHRCSSRCLALRADGAAFIDEAVSRGAVAVVTQKMPALPPAKVTFIQVADARATLAQCGAALLQVSRPRHDRDWRDRHERQDDRHAPAETFSQRRSARRIARHDQLRSWRAHRAVVSHHARGARYLWNDGADAGCRLPSRGDGSEFARHRPAARAAGCSSARPYSRI